MKMYSFTLLFTLVSLFAINQAQVEKCELFKPCDCFTFGVGYHVECSGLSDLASFLAKVKQQLKPNDRHLQSFRLKNYQDTELKANTFQGFQLTDIDLSGNEKLTKIHDDAFNGSYESVDRISITESPRLDSSNLFTIVNKFVNITHTFFSQINLKKIPTRAFSANLSKLVEFNVYDEISKVESYAFANLASVQWINVAMHGSAKDDYLDISPGTFEKDAFAIDKQGDLRIWLNVKGKRISSKAFSAGSLSNMKHPITFTITAESIEALNEQAFLPFLTENNGNKVDFDISDKPIDCQNCENKWLKDHLDVVQNRIKLGGKNVTMCTSGAQLNDKGNFKNC